MPGGTVIKDDVNADAQSVAEEVSSLRRNFPGVTISSATGQFITATYERTPHSRVKTTLTFPEGYPDHPLIVDVATDSIVPVGLKKKLEKELGKLVSDLSGRHEQVCAVFNRLTNFVDTNRFIPCWRELRQCVDLVTRSNVLIKMGEGGENGKGAEAIGTGSSISINDTTGIIKLKLRGGQYVYSCTITIDENYPATKRHEDYGKACYLQLISTNFPPNIETLLTSQAQELVRRMQDGMVAEDAVKISNPIRAPKNFKEDSKEAPKVRLTQQTLKGLKKDTEMLSRVRDLREVDAATVQGNAKVKSHTGKERKDARRTISKLTHTEIEKDKAQEATDKQWQLDEQARMAGYNFSEHDGSNPQPSLLALVTFLVHKITMLPQQRCPVCSERTLPVEPKELKALYAGSSDAKTEKEKKARRASKQRRPIRTYCGCWYHYKCLNKFMTEPPFGAVCLTEGCGRRVFHPDWPSDMKQLERAWANRKAREREIEDAAMFL